MKRLLARPAALLCALLLGAGTARADFFSNWSYTLGLDSGPTFNGASGNSNVSFALNPNGSTGVSDIPVGNLTSNSSSGTPDPVSASYVLTIGVTDTTSGQQHDFKWQGVISGNVSASTTDPGTGNPIPGQSSLLNTFTGQTSPGVFGGPLAESFTLGSHIYTVTISPDTSPAGTNAINGPKGAPTLVDANVTVADATGGNNNNGGGNNVSTTPEPSALVLAGCAVSLVGLCRWRKVPAMPAA
jgi:hypothetical protein